MESVFVLLQLQQSNFHIVEGQNKVNKYLKLELNLYSLFKISL